MNYENDKTYKYLKVWGCLAKVERLKWGIYHNNCVFIGYANNNDAYKFLVYKLYIPYIYIYIYTPKKTSQKGSYGTMKAMFDS